MVNQLRIFSLLSLLLIAQKAMSGESWIDNILSSPVLGIPIVSYSPETSWEFGGAVQAYFVCEGQDKMSVVQAVGAYSLNNQWYIRPKGTIYAGRKNNWVINFDLSYRNYPNIYYDLGNDFVLKDGKSYGSQQANMRCYPLVNLPDKWYIGPHIHYLYEQTSFTPSASMLGIGITAQYDSRDLIYYPSGGIFFKTSLLHYESLNQHFSRLQSIQTDLRHFVPIYKSLIFAWQLKTEWTIGQNSPFQLIPAIGGEDLIRGVRAGMFRDQAMMALQGELRFPIIWRVSGTVFAGIGDVYNLTNWQWRTPKVGYGVGLRLKINKSNINVRFDVARNNLYKSWNTINSYSFYFTTIEAF